MMFAIFLRRRLRHIALFAFSLVFLSIMLVGCNGTTRATDCAKALEHVTSEPDWQDDSTPAQASLFISAHVVSNLANAWLDDLNKRVPDALPRFLNQGFELQDVQFAQDDRNDILVLVRMAPRAQGPLAISRALSVSVVLPLQLDLIEGDRTALSLRLHDASIRFGDRNSEKPNHPLGNVGFNIERVMDQLKELMFRETELTLAVFEPIILDAANLRILPAKLEYISKEDIRLTVLLPDVAAPANPPLITPPSVSNSERVIAGITLEHAAALGDHILRVQGRNGFTRKGRRDGPYYIRLASLDEDAAGYVARATVTRYSRRCVNVELDAHFRFHEPGSSLAAPQFTKLDILNASISRTWVKIGIPSIKKLNRRTTRQFSDVLKEVQISLPLLQDPNLRIDEIYGEGGTLYSVFEIQHAQQVQTEEEK